MEANTTTVSVQEQIRVALDGRTQRWLCREIKMPEDVFSQKMNKHTDFTKEEIKAINTRLKSKIKLT